MKELFFIDPGIVFLNHGSFGATPRPVFETFLNWQMMMERQPVEFLGRQITSLLHTARERLANYLHTQTDNLVYVTNATYGLNVIARSLHLGPADEVLTSNHEYGALDRTWKFLSESRGFKYTNCPIDPPIISKEDFIERFWQEVTPSTKVIFLSHITSPTAVIFPVAEICKRAREQGIITVIDGAHVPGQIDLDLEAIGADFYSGNLHKWLCAPKGAAFLYARPEVQNLIEPLVVSWGWRSETPGPSKFVDEQEWTGTRDFSAFLSVPAAIEFQNSRNWNHIRQECHLLTQKAQQEICSLTGLPPFHPDAIDWYCQMGAAPLPAHWQVPVIKTRLYDEFRIEVPIIDWQGYKLIRFSFQAYNDQNDLDKLLDAIKFFLNH